MTDKCANDDIQGEEAMVHSPSITGEVPLFQDKTTPQLVGISPAIQKLRHFITMVAPTDHTVLLMGETGTGKDLVAKRLHRCSPRRSKTYVDVNCAGIPSHLVENEFFGHRRGAYTDAGESHRGYFEQANQGTLHLDEIGEVPLELQVKLLRAVEEKCITPLNGSKVQLDIRIIASTNRDLERMVQENRFRKDLYHRLAVMTCHLPPLRSRSEDIPCLTEHFLRQECPGREVHVTEDAYRFLQSRSWPGNVRELKHLVCRTACLTDRTQLEADDFAQHLWDGFASAAQVPLRLEEAVAKAEREHIERVLQTVHGDKERAADALGISQRTLYRRLEKHGIEC